MKTKLILHGHFYQPPRENPETGLIDIQPSAAPWSNWNEKIADQCYNANAYSRFIPDGSHIAKLINNYAYMSFNFGPTLMEWLEKFNPDTVDKIKEADRESLRRLGHGNAIAQSYNHTILPLDPPDRRSRQIEWGLESFRRTFRRDAEGFWCPEAAINPDVVDSLVAFGIGFVILSPYQAGEVEVRPGVWTDVSASGAPYMRPYLLEGRTREIPAFFYHPGLASGISFDHYLRDADKLYGILLGIRDRDSAKLIHAATDGEVYGHHEPFGDMALAALIEKITTRHDFELTNYASVLEETPAFLHARLKSGEEKLGTSWSCCHGVGRWMRDCGCATGGEAGWNQEWRTPLRKATDILWSDISAAFTHEMEKEGVDAEKVLSFGYTSSEPRINALMSGYRYASFSATSCGWFFNDISGIETKQNIAYALKAIDIYRDICPDLREKYLCELANAQSNIPEEGTGRDIAGAVAESSSPGYIESAAFFSIADGIDRSADTYGCWKKISVTPDAVTVEHTGEGERYTVPAADCRAFTPSLIMLEKINGIIGEAIGRNFESELKDSETVCRTFASSYIKTAPVPGSEAIRTMVVGTALRSLYILFASKKMNLDTASLFMSVVSRCGTERDQYAASVLVTEKLSALLSPASGKVRIENVISILSAAREAGIEPQLTRLQNLFWRYTDNGRKLRGRGLSDGIYRLALDLNFLPVQR